MAETSLTIPGIRYVVDCGREKQRVYDKATGLSQFVVSWISRAGARQRAGRAGRTGPGFCYRLYSSAVFNDQFAEHSVPEILRTPIEATVLQMKAMHIDDLAGFPFPCAPDAVALTAALKSLRLLGALDESQSITELGQTLARFPVAPRFAKMLVLGHQGGCLPYVVALCAALSTEQLFLQKPPDPDRVDELETEEAGEGGEREEKGGKLGERAKEARRKVHKAFAEARFRWLDPRSDLLTRVRVVGGFLHATAGCPAKHLEVCWCVDGGRSEGGWWR